jgi:hypothetical protein
VIFGGGGGPPPPPHGLTTVSSEIPFSVVKPPGPGGIQRFIR